MDARFRLGMFDDPDEVPWADTPFEVVACEEHLELAAEIAARPAVQRGRRVNRVWGDEALQVAERHDASDIGDV